MKILKPLAIAALSIAMVAPAKADNQPPNEIVLGAASLVYFTYCVPAGYPARKSGLAAGYAQDKYGKSVIIDVADKIYRKLISNDTNMGEFCSAVEFRTRESLPPVENKVEQPRYQWPTEVPKQSRIEDVQCLKVDGTPEPCKLRTPW
jgi:hypothetical protein